MGTGNRKYNLVFKVWTQVRVSFFHFFNYLKGLLELLLLIEVLDHHGINVP